MVDEEANRILGPYKITDLTQNGSILKFVVSSEIRFTAKLFKTTWQEYTKIQLCKFEHWDEVVRMMVFTITGIHSTIFA